MRVKIRKGDTVEVISGKLEDKGKRGEVLDVLPKENRLVIQGVNVRTKHQKQVQTQAGRNMNPGRIKFEAPLDISNVMLVCPKCSQRTRVSIHRDEGGSHRVCKQCEAALD
ncbi:MAG: 50S ribosomal protein L24 [Chloroflexota bacterium]